MKKVILFSSLIVVSSLALSQTQKIAFTVEDPYGGKKVLKNTKGDTIWEIFKEGKVAQRDPNYGRIEKNANGDTIWVKYANEKNKEAEEEESHTVSKADMIASAKVTECPVDVYTGADKQALKNIVMSDWKKIVGPDSKLLKVYITGSQWVTKKG